MRTNISVPLDEVNIMRKLVAGITGKEVNSCGLDQMKRGEGLEGALKMFSCPECQHWVLIN